MAAALVLTLSSSCEPVHASALRQGPSGILDATHRSFSFTARACVEFPDSSEPAGVGLMNIEAIPRWETEALDARLVVGLSAEYSETRFASWDRSVLQYGVHGDAGPACGEPITIRVERVEHDPRGQMFVETSVAVIGANRRQKRPVVTLSIDPLPEPATGGAP